MSRRDYDDWYDEEYERMCQEAEVADDVETDRRNAWVFWTPVKVGLLEVAVLLVVCFLLSLAGVGESWLYGFFVSPLIAFVVWSQQVGRYLHDGGTPIVWRRFWQLHLGCLVIIPLFGFRMWLLFGLLAVVGVFLKLMLGRR